MGVGFAGVKGASARAKGASKWVFINLLLNHGVRGLQGIYFFASAQVASAGCMCSVIVYFLHCICVCDCDGRHESLIMLSHSVMVRRSHLLARCYLGTMCMCTTTVRCSTIEDILHRYHRCGPIFMLEDKGNYRGSSLQMAFRIFRCHRAFKTNEGSLDTSSGDLKFT
jgi:hypothetical protein